MIGLDLAVGIRATLASVAASLQQFTDAVNSSGRTYPAAYIAAWHADLFPGGSAATVIVGERYTPEMLSRAAVWIEDTDSPFGPKPLGDFTGYSGGQRLIGGLRTQTATVSVYHQSQELCTVLWQVLQSRVLLMIPELIAAGWRSFEYTGGGPLGALELASNGWIDIAVRTLGYNGLLQQQLINRDLPIADRNVSILLEGATSPEDIEGAVFAVPVGG